MDVFEHEGWRAYRWTTGLFASHIYLIAPAGSGETILIDAGGGMRAIPRFVKQNRLELKYIILTHRHFDHTVSAGAISRATGAKILAGQRDAKSRKPFSEGGMALLDGDKLTVGKLTIEVISTPGHTPGGVTLSLPGALFTGDTLFAGGVGRTDFRGGDYRALMKSLNRLMEFPDQTAVYPGHGPPTTVGKEKRHNPFIG